MQRLRRFVLIAGLMPATSAAGPAQLTGVSYYAQPVPRIVFDVTATSHQRFYTLAHPSRLVIDFLGMNDASGLAQPPADDPLFTNLRSSVRDGGNLRVVLDLKADADVHVGKGGMPSQVILELVRKTAAAPAVPTAAPPARTEAAPARKAAAAGIQPVKVKAVTGKGRDIVVAIDAGHGGKDTGAIGAGGVLEKDVVFSIARRLQNLLNAQPGMRAVMIRDGDYFVGLKERVRLAESAHADLFVSIHADAFIDPNAHGASVYTLATHGASSQGARWLANSENAVDAGEDAPDDMLSSVLHDLTRTAAKEASQNIGSKVLRSVNTVGHLHRSAVQKAGFVVLQSPIIPSILVETAFISNPDEAYRLTTASYQERMASAVYGGIMAHFRHYAPANTTLARRARGSRGAHPANQTPPATARHEQALQIHARHGEPADG